MNQISGQPDTCLPRAGWIMAHGLARMQRIYTEIVTLETMGSI